jgi:hypothetical protein
MDLTKFVFRVLGAHDELLAWTTVHAQPRPQVGRASCPFYPTSPTRFVVERDGIATSLAIHWCDLDIARRAQVAAPTPMTVGQEYTWTWIEPVWLVSGMKEVPLPPVTVGKSVAIEVPVGALGVTGERQ